MAISGGDGSIVLTTKVDTSGIKTFEKTSKTTAQNIGESFKKLGGIIAATFSITAIINFSKQAGEFATQTEASVQRLVDIYGEAAQSVGDFIDANARAIGMSKASAASFASVYGNLFSVWADQNTNAELTNRYLNMTAVVASKTGRTVQDVQERIRSGLLGNTEAIEDLGVFVNVKTIEMTDAFQRMANGRSWEQLDAYTQQQVRTMAILEQATAKYGNTVADTTATTRAQYQAAYEDFQNTWGQVVNTVLTPVLKILTQVFTIATKGLQVLAGLTGKTVDTSTAFSSQEKAIGGAVENQNDLTDAVKGTNKELKKSLAGFDELNILSQENASASSGAGATGGANVSDLGIGDLGGTLDGSSYVEEVSSTLMAIMGIVALAMVAVGLILLFTGHILWGVGFIIAGAALLTVTMASASEFGYDGIINMLTVIMGIAGGALLALGIILLWIGGVVGTPVAIGMIIAGAALIVGAVAAKAAFAPEDVKGWLSLIMGIAGGALLALGIILCMLGSVPLGVGLIIAGAVSLVSAFAINSNTIVELLKGPIGTIVMLVSTLTLVIGIILACTGAALPLAIGLIAVGAVGLASTVALNWNTIPKKITKFFKDNAWIMAGVSLVLLIIGIILCFTPMLALGIGLIAAGAVSLGATVALNWNAIVDNIKKFVFENPELIALISGGLLILGIILCFVNLVLGISLIAVGAVGLVTTAALNWNAIVDNIKKFVFKNSTLISLISGGLIILGILLCFVVLPLGLSLIAAGAVGLASVVAVNWNTIKEKVSNAFNAVITWIKTYGLLVIGIILCLTGVGIPLGIALIVKWAKDGVKNGVPLANVIVDKVKQVWKAVQQFWNTYIAPIFTAKWWADLGKKAINGLLGVIESGLNWIIDKINVFIGGLSNIVGAVGDVIGVDWNIPKIPRVSIPRLAQGAVIPPNREFLAVLGDQKHGTNIEAPLDTIKQAVAEVLAQVNVGGSSGRIEVPVIIDGREVARAVRNAESNMGTQTVFGGFANAY